MILRNGNPSLDKAYRSVDRPQSRPQVPVAPRRRRVEDYIRDYPSMGVAAALAIGVTIGWLLKRR
jgi:ElaB/YqjD/DUF883 family membrane-anchored ribosome-binding protein